MIFLLKYFIFILCKNNKKTLKNYNNFIQHKENQLIKLLIIFKLIKNKI